MKPTATATGSWRRSTGIREAEERDPRSYGDALMDQNPEILDIVEWTKVPSDEWLAFSLLLRNTVTEMVNRLMQSTR